MPASPACSSAINRSSSSRGLSLRHDPVEQVRAGRSRRRIPAPLRDAAARRCRGGSARRRSRSAPRSGISGKRSFRMPSALVVAAEIVAPLRDAMRLVDREQRDPAAPQQLQASAASPAVRARRRADRARPRAARVRPTPASPGGSAELSAAARTPAWRSASTWSFISAISGETTTPIPGRSSAGSW